MDKIRVGMTKAQILEIMGEPLRKEIYNTPDVWYYYTVSRWSDSISAREESTPVVFKNGVVIGWGVDYYKTNFEFKDPKDIGKGDELSPGNALLKEWEQKYDKQAQEKPKDK
jgi:outer membrane protein assembly factor BamE (lipoprotein component of BamABCDE complex)